MKYAKVFAAIGIGVAAIAVPLGRQCVKVAPDVASPALRQIDNASPALRHLDEAAPVLKQEGALKNLGSADAPGVGTLGGEVSGEVAAEAVTTTHRVERVGQDAAIEAAEHSLDAVVGEEQEDRAAR